MTSRHPTPRRLGRAASGLLIAAVLACQASPAGASHDEPGDGRLPIMSKPIPLRPGEPESGEPESGELEGLVWRGGLELRSPQPCFGGISGLLISSDGMRLTAVSDKGTWLRFPLSYGAEGILTGVGEGRIGGLRGLDGTILTKKRDRDAEALAQGPDGGLLVAFEHNHRVWRYPELTATPDALAPPPKLAQLADNSGIEALAVLGNGDLLAISEGSEDAEASPAYLWRGTAWSRLTYARSGGFRPTGATLLPGGDVLVLERRFSLLEGVRIRLVRVPAASLRPGARLTGTVVATLAPPVSLDNLEGIAARRSEAGETLLYLISDDNFNPLQRTLLLVFALKD